MIASESGQLACRHTSPVISWYLFVEAIFAPPSGRIPHQRGDLGSQRSLYLVAPVSRLTPSRVPAPSS